MTAPPRLDRAGPRLGRGPKPTPPPRHRAPPIGGARSRWGWSRKNQVRAVTSSGRGHVRVVPSSRGQPRDVPPSSPSSSGRTPTHGTAFRPTVDELVADALTDARSALKLGRHHTQVDELGETDR
jgi:hypothetical protein